MGAKLFGALFIYNNLGNIPCENNFGKDDFVGNLGGNGIKGDKGGYIDAVLKNDPVYILVYSGCHKVALYFRLGSSDKRYFYRNAWTDSGKQCHSGKNTQGDLGFAVVCGRKRGNKAF